MKSPITKLFLLVLSITLLSNCTNPSKDSALPWLSVDENNTNIKPIIKSKETNYVFGNSRKGGLRELDE